MKTDLKPWTNCALMRVLFPIRRALADQYNVRITYRSNS